MSKQISLALLAGLVIGALAWIDPLFVPLVLAGPIVSGAVAAGRHIAFRWVALAWATAGVSMVASDWISNQEDRLFHAILTAVMVALAAAGWAIGARFGTRRRARAVS